MATRQLTADDAPRVEVITELERLRALGDQWQALLQASPTGTAFASPAWLLTWYRHFQPRSGVYVVAVWRAGELLGLAPFAGTRLGGRHAGFTLLVSAGTEHGDYGDPLLGPEPAEVAPLIADHLAGLVRDELAAVNLRRLRDDNPLLALLEGRADVTCEPMGRQADYAVVRFTDMDDPQATLARNARKSSVPRNRRRLAQAHGEVVFTTQADDTDAALDHMRDFLARRWAPGEGPRLFTTPGREAFTRDVTAALVAAGLARVSTLTAGGQTMAVTIDHQVGDRRVGDSTSFDPDFRTYSVGLIQLHEVLAGALAAGVTEVDMRSGDFPYKDRWATTQHGTRSIALVAAGRRGRAQLAARRLAMSARARRLLRDERAGPVRRAHRAGEGEQ